MQIAPTAPESIKPLLRPDAVEQAHADIKAAESKLTSPHIEDKREARAQLIRLRKTTMDQLPKPPADAAEEDRMVKRSKELLEHIVDDGMLSQAEMRACPPGAPDAHLAWERRHKAHILEWKNLQLRLRPGEREAANLERHRPTANRLNLDNAYVDRKMMFGVEAVETVAVVFSDEELIALKALDFDEHARVGSMDNGERKIWKKAITLFMNRVQSEKNQKQPIGKKGKREWTNEQRQAARDRMAKARAAKGAKK